MTVQPIRLFGDPVLRTPAEPVVDFDAELRRLVADLTDTMREQNGAGLAAPQLGVGLRVFAFDVDDVLGHLVNPVLEFPDEEEQEGPEGCLSIPGLYFPTVRALHATAHGVDVPITQAVVDVVRDGLPVREMAGRLMGRAAKPESV